MNRVVIISLAALLSAPLAARAGDLTAMARTPGEWEVTMNGGFAQPTTHKTCYHGDKSVADLATEGMKNCSQQSLNVAADRATFDAVCSMMNMQVSVHGTAVPTGDAAFHADTHVHLQGKPPIPSMPPDMNLSIDGRRVGPC